MHIKLIYYITTFIEEGTPIPNSKVQQCKIATAFVPI